MSDPQCLFCRIAAGEIPATVVYQDDDVVAFRDIAPQMPVHVVLVPRTHLAGLNDLGPATAPLLGKLALAGARIAADLGIDRTGYRFISNCGADAGQTVAHLHFHLLGGGPMAGRMV
jgi:histidine triad (HIT) family protein